MYQYNSKFENILFLFIFIVTSKFIKMLQLYQDTILMYTYICIYIYISMLPYSFFSFNLRKDFFLAKYFCLEDISGPSFSDGFFLGNFSSRVFLKCGFFSISSSIGPRLSSYTRPTLVVVLYNIIFTVNSQ